MSGPVKKKPPPPAQVIPDDLARVINRSEDQQLAFVKCVRDAVTLAGEQLQDVRLALLEDPPPAKTSPFLVDLLISLALGPLAGALVSTFVGSSVRAILGSRATVFAAEGAAVTQTTVSLGSLSRAAAVSSTTKLEVAFRKSDSPAYTLWTKVGGAVLNGVVSQARSLPARLAAVDQPVDLIGDTASVAMRRSAYAFARNQESAIRATHRAYREQIAAGKLDESTLWELKYTLAMRLVDPQTLQRVDVQTEREMSLLFEGFMWAIHFRDMKLIHPADPRRTQMTDESLRPILSYLTRRLPHDKDPTTSFSGHYIRLAGLGKVPWFGRRSGYVYSPAHGIDEFGVASGPPPTFDPGELSLFERAVADLQRWFAALLRDGDPTGELTSRGYVNVGPVALKVAASR